jgi:DNA-binding transcriptional ArsR family regulator
MNPTRRDVLERLAATSATEPRSTTAVEALARALDADEQTVAKHVRSLEALELARAYPDGRVRVTITAEELLELDVAGQVVVDATPADE